MIKFLVDMLKEPSLLLGVIVFIGLILQHKRFSEVLMGTLKTVLGFLILQGGAGILVGTIEPLGRMFEAAFNVQGILPNNEAIVALALKKYGSPTALIMIFGMLVNILVAKFTRLNYIYLSGQCTFAMACMLSIILSVAGATGVLLIGIGSILLGFIMAGLPAITQPYMKGILGDDKVALGHTGCFAYALSGWIGSKVGKGSKSTEEMEVHQDLKFLKDSSMSIAITMSILYIVLALFSGREFIEVNLSGGQNFIVYSILKGITFSAGVVVILKGVQLVLEEIVPAFTGISEKLVPNAKPALDCSILFPHAPNAVFIGFVSSFIGGVLGMIVLGRLGLVLILPGVVPHFFCGATAGIFGNSTGGRRGAVLGAFVHGLIITMVPLMLFNFLGDLRYESATFSDSDYGVIGLIVGIASKNIFYLILLILILFIASIWSPNTKKYKVLKNN